MSATPSGSAGALTTEQRERYSIVPTVIADPQWCGPVASAVVIARQVLPTQGSLSDSVRSQYQQDMNALGRLPGLPRELQNYLSDPDPAFDMGFAFIPSVYEQSGRSRCPETEKYMAAHASGPKERHGGYGFVPYAIPTSSASP